MDAEIDIWIPCYPPKATAQSGSRLGKNKRTGEVFFMPQNPTATGFLAIVLFKYAPREPMKGTLVMRAMFRWGWNKSDPKWLRNQEQDIPVGVRPDADNLTKALFDTLQKLRFYENDGQISDYNILTRRGHDPGLAVRIGYDPMPTRLDSQPTRQRSQGAAQTPG
jgi:Holliday junction resolvase RusA-like endonuclease